MKIALDAMGGDFAPSEPVKGALLAVKELGVEIALVGPEAEVEAELARHPKTPGISVVPSGGSIAMEEDSVVQAVRQRRDASINVAMSMVKSGEAAAAVSAGNTGAVMASALFQLGRIRGIERPALGLLLTYNNVRVLLIDTGANVDCRPKHLLQFGQMGAAFVEKVVGVPNPRVGLLNIGEEPNKGTELLQEAHQLLAASGLNFVGNIEGRQAHTDKADVLVADGFTGNMALKVGEGISDYIMGTVRSVIRSNPLYIGAALVLKPALRRAWKKLQYQEYGGANLIGVNGVVVIAHGRSDPVAIKNAIKVASSAAKSGVLETMRAEFANRGELDKLPR